MIITEAVLKTFGVCGLVGAGTIAINEINRSKKKLLKVSGYNDRDLYIIDANTCSPACIKKDVYETLNKWLEKYDYVRMTFTYADNKAVWVRIEKTKHNHHYA